MTTYTSLGRSAHQAVSANTELIVILDHPYRYVEVAWSSATPATPPTSPLYGTVTTGVNNSVDTAAVIAADGTFHVDPAGTRILRDDVPIAADSPTKVRVISAAAGLVHVTGHRSIPGAGVEL